MQKTVYIRNLPLGEGMPKICVPVMGSGCAEIIQSAERALECGPDIIEWRVDFMSDVRDTDAVLAALKKLRMLLDDVPLLFTFRTKKEGGEQELSGEDYAKLYGAVLKSRMADAVDIELFTERRAVCALLEQAKNAGQKVVMSSHDFQKTPPLAELVQRLTAMQQLGADIAKIAVMPSCAADVLTLLGASEQAAETLEIPVITMSMGKTGMVSRLLGESFGSALTFGMAGRASAPGQIPVRELRSILEKIHQYL